MTTPTVTIAALRTLNARLMQDNERLARENELLRAQLSAPTMTTPSAQGPASIATATAERPDQPGPRQMADVVRQIQEAEEASRRRSAQPGDAQPGDVQPDLVAIAQESATNAAVTSYGSISGGQLRSVGFATTDGFLQAIRRGVTAETHAGYIRILRERHVSESEIAALPGPVPRSNLPVGPGTTHVPSGVPLFDRPPGERRFLVGGARERGAEPRTAAPSTAATPTGASTPSAPIRPPSTPLRPPVRIVAGGMPVRRTQAQPPQPQQPQPQVQVQAQRSAPRPQTSSVPPAAPVPPARAPSATTIDPNSPNGDDASARFALLELD